MVKPCETIKRDDNAELHEPRSGRAAVWQLPDRRNSAEIVNVTEIPVNEINELANWFANAARRILPDKQAKRPRLELLEHRLDN